MDTSEVLLMWLCDVLPFYGGPDQTDGRWRGEGGGIGVSARTHANPHCVHLCVHPAGIHMGPADSRKRTTACGQNMRSVHKWGCGAHQGSHGSQWVHRNRQAAQDKKLGEISWFSFIIGSKCKSECDRSRKKKKKIQAKAEMNVLMDR